MELSSHLFQIRPAPGIGEEEFEKSLAESLPRIAKGFLHRNVSGASQSLFKGRDEKEQRTYLWNLELVLVEPPLVPFGGAFEKLVKALKDEIGSRGAVSFVAAVDEKV
jgi:hypothetical protein